MPVKVGGILLDIQTNTAKVVKDIDQIKGNLNKFSSDAKRIFRGIGYSLGAAFSIRAIKNFITEGVKTIDTLQDMSQSAAMASKEFQGLLQAAKYAGVESAGVATAIKTLNTNLYYARHGLGEYKRIFEDLNVNVHRPTKDVLYAISDRFSKMTDETFRAGLASKAFGRSGTQLIPVLKDGAGRLKEITDRMERFGAIVSDETMENMDQVNQNFIDMASALSGIKLQILAGMSDELERISNVVISETQIKNFEKLGDILGKIAALYFSIQYTQIALTKIGRESLFFDVEGMKKSIDEYKKVIKDLWVSNDLKKKEKNDTNEIIQLTDKQSKIIEKIIKGQKSKIDFLKEEKEMLRDIQITMLKNRNITKSLDENYYVIAKRIQEINAEMKRLQTVNVWGNIKYGFIDYYNTIKDRSKQIQDFTINSMKSIEDALVNFTKTYKMEWKSLADAIIADIMRIVIRQQLIIPTMTFLKLAPAGGTVIAGPPPLINNDASLGSGGGNMRAKRGRTFSNASINSSNNLQNIVSENTYLMERDVEDFVNVSEMKFNELGRNLRSNLMIGNIGSVGTGIPTGTPTGGAMPGGSVSGVAPGGAGLINISNVTDPINAINKAIQDPSAGNIIDALVETNMITVTTKAATDIFNKVVGGIKKWHFHTGLSSNGIKGFFDAPRLHAGLAPDEFPAILQRGETVIPKSQSSKGVTINVPINMAERNPLLAQELRSEIERVVIDVMRRYA